MPRFTYDSDEDRTYPALPVRWNKQGEPTETVAFEGTKGADVEAQDNPDPSRFVKAKADATKVDAGP